MSKKGKIIIVLGIILILIILVVVNIKRSTGGTIKVQVGKVKRGDITQVVSGSGRVQPEVQVKISANVSGKIVKLHVKEGEQVKKGQILVELDRTRYEAAVDQAKSNLKSAKASLKKARSEYRRFQELYEKNLCSLADLESAEASLLLAESNVEQAEASLKQAADDLSKTTLISPIDGTVTKLNKEEGEIALGSMFQEDVIMIVADLSKMEVVTEIDENDVVLVSLGDKAKIEVDAIPDTIFEGRVSEIAHTATTRGMGTAEEVTNFEVKVAIEGGAQQLRPGMSATVDIETETHRNVLHIPIQCVTMRMPKAE
ncbi:efflux RND transporter periplasmic adaptor subunit, partial [candidate division KSB1 bacterium]